VEALAAVEPVDDVDARRLELTRATIATAMITYPPLARFPEVEDAAWSAIQEALRGRLGPDEAVQQMQAAAEQVLAPEV
jgi:ABC-type glycerol-3-phosphate transport system substrate-binding protein